LWYDRAISSYEKCIEIYPLYPNVYENLAFVYGEKAKLAQEVALKKENFIKAESILAKAIDSLGLDKQTLFNNRYFMLDQLILIDSANNQVYFTKMIGVAEKSPEFKSDDFHRIIYAYFNLKESSRLIDRVQKEGTNYPELSNVYAEFSKKYFESGNVKEAIVLLDVYCQLNPGDLSSRSNLAMLYEMDGQLNEALVRYEAILKESPEQLHTLELYNNLKVRMKK
jgi:tetratricopeptide (TPR) repeat protein